MLCPRRAGLPFCSRALLVFKGVHESSICSRALLAFSGVHESSICLETKRKQLLKNSDSSRRITPKVLSPTKVRGLEPDARHGISDPTQGTGLDPVLYVGERLGKGQDCVKMAKIEGLSLKIYKPPPTLRRG